MTNFTFISLTVCLFAVAACSAPVGEVSPAYDGIEPDEVISLGGDEPFWDIKIEGDQLTYTTPENIEGLRTTAERFAGNGGLSFSGTLESELLTALVTPGECDDGMSDRTYPFTATVQIGDQALQGCGYTDKQPFTGEEHP